MPHSDVKARSRSTNKLPVPISNPNIFGNTITVQVSGDSNPENRVNFFNSQLVLSFVVSNNTTTSNSNIIPFTILKPGLGWISQYNYNIMDKTGKVYSYSSLPNRGDIGAILFLTNNSYNQTIDVARPQYALAPITQSTYKFQVEFSLRYLLDIMSGDRYLDFAKIDLNVTFQPIFNIFSFPATASNWNITCYQAYLTYDIYNVDVPMSDMYYLEPPRRKIYSITFPITAGQSSITMNPVIPGRPYYFGFYFSNSTSLYNAWPNSTPSYAQVSNMNKSWPPVATYDFLDPSDPYFDPTFGYTRWYRDYRSVTDKMEPKEDTYVTADKWISEERIYFIEVSDYQQTNGTFTLVVTQAAPAPADCTMTVFSWYMPQEMMVGQYETDALI